MGAKPPCCPPRGDPGGGPSGGPWGGPGGSETHFWLGKSDTEKIKFPEKVKSREKISVSASLTILSNEIARFLNI